MKRVIAAIVISLCSTMANAALLGYTGANISFPDESTANGLPAAIPCVKGNLTEKDTLVCTWMHYSRVIKVWDDRRGEDVVWQNQFRGICRRGVCQDKGTQVGTLNVDTNFILSVYYYIAPSTDGKPIAYLFGHGPAAGQVGLSYAQAGAALVEFYEISGATDKDIADTMSMRYQGGWDQYQADQGSASKNTVVSRVEVKTAKCNQMMDDECYINDKRVPIDSLGMYLPKVNRDRVEAAGGVCETPICYDKDLKPIGINENY